MAAPETLRARQVALLLHGLAPAVRRQVLAKVDAPESARLQALLDELTKLGVSQPLSWYLQDLSWQPHPRVSTSTERTLTAQEQAERLSAEDVVRSLQSCAPATVAQLLRAGAWPWQARVLDLMPDARRAEVLGCMRNESAALAPAVLASLCERLCLHVAHLHADRPQARESSAHLKKRAWRIVLAAVRARVGRWAQWMR